MSDEEPTEFPVVDLSGPKGVVDPSDKQRQHEAYLAEQATEQAEWKAQKAQSDARHEGFRARSEEADLERSKVNAEREKEQNKFKTFYTCFAAFLAAVVLGFLWLVFNGPSASEQLEDQFKHDCINKGWDYSVSSGQDGFGPPRGDCRAP